MKPYYEKAKCPRCGTPLEDVVLTVDPPIYLARCPECGFEKHVEPQRKWVDCPSPYYTYISARIWELCEAIKQNSPDAGKHNQVRLWTAEIQCLNEMDRMLRRVEKEKVWVENKDGTLKEVE